MDAQALTFSLIDTSSGFEATPDRVRLEALTDFTSDVSSLLRGTQREVDPGQLDVAVRAGSVAIETAPIVAAPTLFRDLLRLVQSELLDQIDARRRDVIERWQKVARQTPGVSFRISAPFLPRAVHVDDRTDYRADDADQWVMVERYVTGEIQDLGGAKKGQCTHPAAGRSAPRRGHRAEGASGGFAESPVQAGDAAHPCALQRADA